jgi:uncharacterized Tic20 family protein
VHENRDLVDLAVLISLWVLAVESFVNLFGTELLDRYLRNRREYTAQQARCVVNKVVVVTQVLVVLLLLAAVVLGSLGWFDP